MTDLESFFAAALSKRPFALDRVSEPSLDDPDVPRIHGEAFELLVRSAMEVYEDRRGKGVVLLGGAGVGKSHILSRLWRWSKHDGRAIMVFLHNLLVEPDRMPRYMLSATLSVLTRGRHGCYEDTPLYDLFRSAVVERVPHGEILTQDRAEELLEEFTIDGRRESRLLLGVMLRLCLNIHHASLEQNHNPKVIEAALDWMSGDFIEAEEARGLGLLPKGDQTTEPLRIDDDQVVESVFLVLVQLARAAQRPFILAIDQFDNLSKAQVSAMMRFLHVLIDHCPNFLCIVSGVRANVMQLVDEGTIPAANWDRVAEEEANLRLVSVEEGKDLLLERLEAFRAPFAEVQEVTVAVKRDPFFPFTQEWYEEVVKEAVELRPRQLVRAARRAWSREVGLLRTMGGVKWLARWPDGDCEKEKDSVVSFEVLVDSVINEKLKELVDERLAEPSALPPDTGNLCSLFRELLVAFASRSGSGIRNVRLPGEGSPYDIWIEYASGRATGVTLMATKNAQISTNTLRKLVRDASPPDRRLLVTDEERMPLRRTSRAIDYLRALVEGKAEFRHLELDGVLHFKLDALARILALPRSGDLEVEHPSVGVRSLTESDVLDAFDRLNVFYRHPLLAEFLPPRDTPPLPTSIELRSRVLAAADEFGTSCDSLARKVVAEYCLPPSAVDATRNQLVELAGSLSLTGQVAIERNAQGDTIIRGPGPRVSLDVSTRSSDST